MNHETYNGKPIIIGPVPWYRNHIFPWGVYQLGKLPLNAGDFISGDGQFSVGDGGENRYEVFAAGIGDADSGSFIDLGSLQEKETLPDRSIDVRQFGDDPYTVVTMIEDDKLNIGDVVYPVGILTKDGGGDRTYEIVVAGTGVANGVDFIDLRVHQAKLLFSPKIEQARQIIKHAEKLIELLKES